MIYWTLIPQSFSNRIGHVYIKIHAPFEIKDSIDVWGYGNYGGTAYVYDGYIEMQSNGSLSTDEYMTILVKFPNGTFETVNILDKNFNYYYNMAEEGSIAYQEEGTNLIDKLMGMIVGIFTTIFFIGSLMIGNREYQKTQLDFGPGGKKIPKDVMYYRDIPCNKDLFRAYYIANVYGLLKNKTDILGAIILKWLKDGQIRIEQKEVGNLFKKEDTVIILNETTEDVFADEKERELFRMLKIASKDGILENKEFEQWCKKSYEKVLGWFDNIKRRK